MLSESFQNRSQTKSKAFFIILFITIGAFLIFKLTQDGLKYASPFEKDAVHLPENTRNTTNENERNKTEEKNNGILKDLLNKLGNFNSTITEFDEKFKNFTETYKGYFENATNAKFINETQSLLKNLQNLKNVFEIVTNSSDAN